MKSETVMSILHFAALVPVLFLFLLVFSKTIKNFMNLKTLKEENFYDFVVSAETISANAWEILVKPCQKLGRTINQRRDQRDLTFSRYFSIEKNIREKGDYYSFLNFSVRCKKIKKGIKWNIAVESEKDLTKIKINFVSPLDASILVSEGIFELIQTAKDLDSNGPSTREYHIKNTKITNLEEIYKALAEKYPLFCVSRNGEKINISSEVDNLQVEISHLYLLGSDVFKTKIKRNVCGAEVNIETISRDQVQAMNFIYCMISDIAEIYKVELDPYTRQWEELEKHFLEKRSDNADLGHLAESEEATTYLRAL